MNQFSFILIGSLVLATAASAQTESASKLQTIVRDNKSQTVVEYDFWSYEYPSPVIDVSSKLAGGKTTITAQKSLVQLGQPVSCTIKNGIYHPWSSTENSIERFTTLSSLREFRARRAHTLTFPDYSEEKGPFESKIRVRRGDVFTRLIYTSEGYCNVEHVNSKLVRKDLVVECSVFDNKRLYAETAKSTPLPKEGETAYSEQWLTLSCAEGYSALVRDEDLLKVPTVKMGAILGYGTVGAEEDQPKDDGVNHP